MCRSPVLCKSELPCSPVVHLANSGRSVLSKPHPTTQSRTDTAAKSQISFVTIKYRGVYAIQTLKQMLHEKSWAKDFSQSWGGKIDLNEKYNDLKCVQKPT